MKICKKCNQNKPLNEYYLNRSMKDGRKSECKECSKAYMALYSLKYPNRCKESVKNYRNAHKTEAIEYKREWESKESNKLRATWYSMKQRCYNPNSAAYKNYGGRGIKVCDKWLKSFEAFYDDMGTRPEGMSIDRINNDGNYEPSNCKWSTPKEQSSNRRNCKEVAYST